MQLHSMLKDFTCAAGMFREEGCATSTLVVGGINLRIIGARITGITSSIFVTIFLIRVGYTNAIINAI